MSNQLDRFQGLSEARWPTSLIHDEPSGEGRKALSRYINEYIEELEKSDAKMLSNRRKISTTPPETWADDGPKLPMSRQDYIKKQNALFRELTGHNSWAEMSSLETAKDSKNAQLMSAIELYMAALDEKIYMSADYTRSIIGVRDKAVRDEFEKLKIDDDTVVQKDGSKTDVSPGESVQDGEKMKLIRAAVELRAMYRDLWVQHSQLSHQRDALEVEMSHLRYDHALQLAKVLRLEYATHSLGQRLVDAQSFRVENEKMKEDLMKQEREKEMLQTAIDALTAKCNAQKEELDELIKIRAEDKSNGASAASLDTRIQRLYDELIKIKASEDYLRQHSGPTTSPLETLDRTLALIEISKDDADKRIASLVESFSQQYRVREQELLTQVAVLEKEKQIIIARCEKLERESSEANSDLSYLEQRTLSLVLMLKSVRASLDGTSSNDQTRVPNESTSKEAQTNTNTETSTHATGSDNS